MGRESIHTTPEFVADLKLKGFKIVQRDANPIGYSNISRRDFYVIVLFTGHVRINYADRSLDLDGVYLFFANPLIPYSTDILSANQSGYSCFFTDEFFKVHDRSTSLLHSPIFQINGTPAFKLTNQQYEVIADIFTKMQREESTGYLYKDDLIRNYINLIIHEALRMQTTGNVVQHHNASTRIATLFLELLERQFPIVSPNAPLLLKSAQDYARNLSIHVNYLNRTVKKLTGKSTTNHIAERITAEALALLQYTDWSIADIAYGLGFEYTTYFNNFFKKMTGKIPKAFRP